MAQKSKQWLSHALLTRPLRPVYAKPEQFQPKGRAVIAVPFNCYLDGNRPDRSNAAIATIADRFVLEEESIFIGQREHTNILQRMGTTVRVFKSADGERVESQRLVRWQSEQIRNLKLDNEVILVGLPDHLGRVAMLAEYFGLRPVIPIDCEDVPYDESDRPGAQSWCKSPERFVPYEKLVARPGTIAKLWLGKF